MRPADAQLIFLKGILKYGKNDKAFQLLLDIDCIIKTKGSIPTKAVSHRRKMMDASGDPSNPTSAKIISAGSFNL